MNLQLQNLRDEFADAVLSWRCANEQFFAVDAEFVDTTIHQMNAAEARIDALIVAAHAATDYQRPTLEEALRESSALAAVATLSEDRHLRYKRRGAPEAEDWPVDSVVESLRTHVHQSPRKAIVMTVHRDLRDHRAAAAAS